MVDISVEVAQGQQVLELKGLVGLVVEGITQLQETLILAEAAERHKAAILVLVGAVLSLYDI
jgi:hypothetical protein